MEHSRNRTRERRAASGLTFRPGRVRMADTRRNPMPAKNGDTVRVHYTGTLEDGTVFDSSRGREPLEFILGRRTLIEGFEDALPGREAGDRLRVTIPAARAFGEVDEELFFTVPPDEIPANIAPHHGLRLFLTSPEADLEVTVARADERAVILDANHPLAGKALHFDIEILSVK
jgi:peptidylprolyl isomerase